MIVLPVRRSVELKVATALDDEINRQAIGGTRFNRANDGNERTSGSYQSRRPLLDLPAAKRSGRRSAGWHPL
jgi:hypothetical protein